MMFTLMVSYNAGCSYHPDLESKNLEDLADRCSELDGEGWRWYIEDENSNMVRVSAVHRQIADFLARLQDSKKFEVVKGEP